MRKVSAILRPFCIDYVPTIRKPLSYPSPKEQLHVFHFRGADCIYRDHLGRRVVADFEGIGTFDSIGDASPFDIDLDGIETRAVHSEFYEGLLAYAPDGKDVEIAVSMGRNSPLEAKAERMSGLVRGVGWVVDSSLPVSVDSLHEVVTPQGKEHPLPFFLEAELGDNALVHLSSEVRSNVVDSFEIRDTEALKAREWEAQNCSDRFDLDSCFADGTPLAAQHFSHLNAASWNVEVPDDCVGIVLRKRYDRFHGRQRARVLINDRFVRVWYCPCQSRKNRWGYAQFGLDQNDLGDRGLLRVTIDPPAGTPLWDVSAYEAIGIFPR